MVPSIRSSTAGMVLLLLSVTAVLAQGSGTGQAPKGERQPGRISSAAGDARLPMLDRRFMVATGMGDMMEIDLSQLALRQGSSEAVRNFAQRLIRDHQQSSTQLQALATSKGVTMPTGMMAMMRDGAAIDPTTGRIQGQDVAQGGEHADMPGMAELERLGLRHLPVEHRDMRMVLAGLSGPEFDRVWSGEQSKHHAKTVADFEFHARNAADPDVRSFAERNLPILKEHLQTARDLARRKSSSRDNSNR